MPACNGRVLTTCNADGSGFAAGGTDCSPKYCSAGACVDYLFHEDFEDGDFLGWTTGTGTYTRSVVTTTAAAGSVYSLYLVKTGGTLAYNDGIYQTFGSPLAPTSIGWYGRVPSVPFDYAGNFSLFSGPTPTDQLVRVYFHYIGSIYFVGSTTATKPYTTNTWYHIELRNINWVSRTFDAYVDGVLVSTGMHFSGVGTSIGRVDLFDYYYSSGDPAYFDQIDFLP